jgi:hypothetical protein
MNVIRDSTHPKTFTFRVTGDRSKVCVE